MCFFFFLVCVCWVIYFCRFLESDFYVVYIKFNRIRKGSIGASTANSASLGSVLYNSLPAWSQQQQGLLDQGFQQIARQIVECHLHYFFASLYRIA